MRDSSPLVAGIELGGTKCVCILASGPDDVKAEVRVPTTTPVETVAAIEKVLGDWQSGEGFAAVGIGSFGPIDLDRCSPGYGRITSTPKPGWGDTEVATRIAARFGVPVGFDTDVNGAAMAEGRWGAARGLSDFVYITIGTGVGVGLVVGGCPVSGFTHSEGGHVRVARMGADSWPGCCPFHGDCVEGLASGPAIAARTGAAGETLPPNHEVWPLVAHCLGQLLHALVLITAPRRILLGGGVVSGQPQLFPMIRSELVRSINRYVVAPELEDGIDSYVVAPALGSRAGPMGAIALGLDALATPLD